MKDWMKRYPPYEGEEPYLYFAFAQADSAGAWKILRPLLERGCRVWYSSGPAGSASELLRRQTRSGGAELTLIYLTDAACADKDIKSNILVNQKFDRKLLCLDPDEQDRRLSMGLREDIPHIPLYKLGTAGAMENAVIHADGFSQEILGEPMQIRDNDLFGKLTGVFSLLAAVLLLVSFLGFRYLGWFRPAPRDELQFSDPVIRSALREASGGAITEELAETLRVLELDALPESWEELSRLPALERIRLPQQALEEAASLPDGDYTIELSGGEGA